MNNVVNIIDRQFNFLGQVDNYESLILNKSFSGIGSFELHVNENTTNADKLIKENIIFTTNKKAYIILHRSLSSTNKKFVLKGLEVKSYLARLITYPPSGQAYHRVNSNAETVIKAYVSNALTIRGITEVVVATNQSRGNTLIYQTRYKSLAEELEKISLASGIGWDITLDLVNKKFIFDVVEGSDRTANQILLPPAIFSIQYDNISEQELIESKLNYANVAIVGGQGEGVDRIISEVGTATGLDRFEIFVDARDIETTSDLPSRGQQKLSEMQEVVTFDSRVLTDKNLIYEEDFYLGDSVTILNKKWDVTLDTKINTMTEIYESSGFRLDITFGSNIPTVLDIIKQATDTPIVEGGSSDSGLPGTDGVGLDYLWSGTSLGVKREDEITYTYVNLIGTQGIQGIQGVAGQGVPIGGTVGQVLSKIDSTNYNTQWLDSSGGAEYIVGTYTGDGVASRGITLGFKPSVIFISLNDSPVAIDASSPIRTVMSVDGSPAKIGSYSIVFIAATGITVYYNAAQNIYTNQTGKVYRYVAFK